MSIILPDSSCWIEIFSEGKLAQECEAEIKRASDIIVPTLVIYEVYKKIRSCLSEDLGLSAVASLSTNSVSELTREIALLAADLSLEYKLPMADSMVLAHAEAHEAQLVTLDKGFLVVPHVRVLV